MGSSSKEVKIALKKAHTSISSIINMIDEDKYCIDILQQLLAVNGLIKSASNKLLEKHLNTCFSEGIKSQDIKLKDKLVKEVLDIVNLGSKK